MRVTLPDVLFAQERMLQLYPRPKRFPSDVAEMAKIYLRELGDLDVEAFRFGVNAYCRTDARYYPNPGELRGLAQALGGDLTLGQVVAAGIAGTCTRCDLA